jgi:hypothetical protein
MKCRFALAIGVPNTPLFALKKADIEPKLGPI